MRMECITAYVFINEQAATVLSVSVCALDLTQCLSYTEWPVEWASGAGPGECLLLLCNIITSTTTGGRALALQGYLDSFHVDQRFSTCAAVPASGP